MKRSKLLGCPTLMFIVDMVVPGARYRDYRLGLADAQGFKGALRRVGQALMKQLWTWDVGILGRPHALGNVAPVLGPNTELKEFFAWIRNNFEPNVNLHGIEWIRSHWSGSVIIKGILDQENARLAADAGVDGIVVSNHGGRQLDGTLSSARAFPPIADAVGGRMTISADGDIRSGLDVLRMLALGADGVLLDRAWVYAPAAGGEQANVHLFSLVQAEMNIAMALTGTTYIKNINRNRIHEIRAKRT